MFADKCDLLIERLYTYRRLILRQGFESIPSILQNIDSVAERYLLLQVYEFEGNEKPMHLLSDNVCDQVYIFYENVFDIVYDIICNETPISHYTYILENYLIKKSVDIQNINDYYMLFNQNLKKNTYLIDTYFSDDLIQSFMCKLNGIDFKIGNASQLFLKISKQSVKQYCSILNLGMKMLVDNHLHKEFLQILKCKSGDFFTWDEPLPVNSQTNLL